MFNNIVKSCLFVSENSKDVKINYNKIDELLNEEIPHGKYWGESNAFGFMNHSVEKIVNFLLPYQAIGFSFWDDNKWNIETEEGIIDGSFALIYIFVENLDLFTDYNKLADLSFENFKDLLKGNNEIPLLKERYDILISLARIVNEKMNGNFYQYIKDIDNDEELFEIIINNFPMFKDERIYEGKTIYFYKLASLLTSDIMHVRNIKEDNIFDYSHIVGCADYKIPQVLRALGLVDYSTRLSEIVDSKQAIPVNSTFEVEIRASVIAVIDYIKKKKNMCGMDVNDFLWLSSQKIKMVNPYHLTRTTNY